VGGVGSSVMALRLATASYSTAAQDAGLAYASDDPAIGELGALTTVAETAAELLARLAPPEPHLGSNIDIRV